MGGATAFEYVLWFTGFAILGLFLFVTICLLKKRRREPVTYIADRYGQDPHVDYIPPQRPYSIDSLAKGAAIVAAGTAVGDLVADAVSSSATSDSSSSSSDSSSSSSSSSD